MDEDRVRVLGEARRIVGGRWEVGGQSMRETQALSTCLCPSLTQMSSRRRGVSRSVLSYSVSSRNTRPAKA